MMKIALVYDAIYPYVKGGAEKRLWELAIRLARRGHDVHLFGMKFWDGPAVIERDGVHLHGVCRPFSLYSGGRRSIRQAVWFSFRLFFPLLKEKWDIIDCQQFPYLPCFSAKLVSLLKRTPLVITWIEVWGDSWTGYLGTAGLVGRWVEKRLAFFRDPAIAISSLTARRLGELYSRPVQAVVPVGIDCPGIRATPPAPGKTDLIFVGRLIREKNADLLVSATAILRKGRPGIRVLIIGEGPEQEKIGTLIRNSRLEAVVSLVPFFADHQDVIASMKASKVFVLPSVREGFGITTLEALACGLPVVTVDHPANAARDLVSEQTGLLSTGTPEDLAEKIDCALRNHEAMRNACIRAAESFAWDRVVDDLESVYGSVVRSVVG